MQFVKRKHLILPHACFVYIFTQMTRIKRRGENILKSMNLLTSSGECYSNIY